MVGVCAPLLLSFCLATFSEADWVDATCERTEGIEHVLPTRLRVDCLTETHAIEYDWGHKWAEGIGQAITYGLLTGKIPGLRLIVRKDRDVSGVNHARRTIELLQQRYGLVIRLETIP